MSALLMYLIIYKVDPGILTLVFLVFVMLLYCISRVCFTNTPQEEVPVRRYTEPVRVYNPSSVIIIVNPEAHYNLGYRMEAKV
jgi:hypothetical protein